MYVILWNQVINCPTDHRPINIAEDVNDSLLCDIVSITKLLIMFTTFLLFFFIIFIISKVYLKTTNVSIFINTTKSLYTIYNFLVSLYNIVTYIQHRVKVSYIRWIGMLGNRTRVLKNSFDCHTSLSELLILSCAISSPFCDANYC